MRLDRRRLLALLAAAGLAACDRQGARTATPTRAPTSGSSPTATATATATPTRTPTPAPTTEAEPTEVSRPKPYEPVAGDVYPNAKRLAGRFAQALVTYGSTDSLEGVVQRAATDVVDDFDVERLLSATAPLYREGSGSTGEVVYAQLGGLGRKSFPPRSAAVMVITSQEVGGDRAVRTLDVRLRLKGDAWALESLASAGGDPVDRPDDLPAVAGRVLDDDRIELPDSARWDIHRGIVDERLLAVMARMAKRFSYAVTVLQQGHPLHVFGSDPRRVSNHTAGRAVDVWAVNGEPVVLQQPQERGDAYGLAEFIFDETKVPELGSPWALDDFGGRSFTDLVHDDHLHVAFDRPQRPAHEPSQATAPVAPIVTP